MFRIIKIDGTELGVTDYVNYIKIGDSGSFTNTSEEDAVGVAFNSVAYGLVGRAGIEGAESVVVSEIDGGNSIFALQQGVLDNTEMLLNMQYESDLKSIGGAV